MKLTNKQLRKMIKEELQKQKKLNESVDPAIIAVIQQAMTQDPFVYKALSGALAGMGELAKLPFKVAGGMVRGAKKGAGVGGKASGSEDEPTPQEIEANKEKVMALVDLINSIPKDGGSSEVEEYEVEEYEVEEYEGEVEDI